MLGAATWMECAPGVILWLVTPPMQQEEDVDSDVYICLVWRTNLKVRRTEPAVHFDFGSAQSYGRASPPSPLPTGTMLHHGTSAGRGKTAVLSLICMTFI